MGGLDSIPIEWMIGLIDWDDECIYFLLLITTIWSDDEHSAVSSNYYVYTRFGWSCPYGVSFTIDA